jgi:sterol desaturase/sphingolipid hydroxylase (fatty acid hydroxylase superfamily)
LHHSADHRHVNLGSALVIWDQLLGTWKGAGIRPETLVFGIKKRIGAKPCGVSQTQHSGF